MTWIEPRVAGCTLTTAHTPGTNTHPLAHWQLVSVIKENTEKTLSDYRMYFCAFLSISENWKICWKFKSAYHGRGTCPVVNLQCSTMLKDLSVPKSLSSSSIHTVSTCFLADKNLPKQFRWCLCVCVKSGGCVSMGVRRLGCRYACVWYFHFDYENQEPKK